MQIHNIFDMEAKINIFQNNAKDSNVILASGFNEMDLSIKLPINNTTGSNLVNARDLHGFLGVKRDFSTWIKDRIEKYDFSENEDYTVLKYDYLGNILSIRLPKSGESDTQNVSRIEYALTLDMAKELSMIENNDKGRMARKYFIEVENRYKIPKNYAEALRRCADHVEEIENLRQRLVIQTQIAEQEKAEKETAVKTLVEKQEDLEFAESFVEPGENDMLVRQVAAKLEQNNIIIAEKNLRKFLQEIKFFTKRVEDGQYELRADMIKKGYAFYRSYYVDKYSGEQVHKQTVYITGLGYRAITKAIKTNCKDIFLKYGRFQESYL